MSKRIIAMLLGALALFVIVGCGSSGDSSDSTSADSGSLTKAELIKQGDAICEEGNKEIESEANDFADENGIDTEKPSKSDQEEVITEVVAPAIAAQAEKIGDLGAPSGEEDEVEAIVAAVESGAEEAEADPSSILEESSDGGPFAEANELATAYGFKVCGGE